GFYGGEGETHWRRWNSNWNRSIFEFRMAYTRLPDNLSLNIMKAWIGSSLVVIISSITCLIAASQDKSPVASKASAETLSAAPRIQFSTPTFDFGKVEAGTAIKHDFIFTNTGNAVLEIRDVKPSCGCTTAGQWDRLVQPGKTGSIPVK